MIAEADAEVLVIRAEAEQEAYRLVATARREAQDVTRGARFEAERTVLELRAQPERILPGRTGTRATGQPPRRTRAGTGAAAASGPAETVPVAENIIRVIQPPGSPAPGGRRPRPRPRTATRWRPRWKRCG